MSKRRIKMFVVSIAPPKNDVGVRVVLYRHLVERTPFEIHVATNADVQRDNPNCTRLELPFVLRRLRNSRLGPFFSRWLTDYETQIWPLRNPQKLDRAIAGVQPDVILALADNCLSAFAERASRKYSIPLAGLFLDWVPIMKAHYGHDWTIDRLNQRFHRFYQACDLAFCTSDGMQDVLGTHPNSHVIYPMPGKHLVPKIGQPPKSGRFRLVYVGNALDFYGRMLAALVRLIEKTVDLEIIIVGPFDDWPSGLIERARQNGICLGFKPPEEAAAVLAGADALLVVMSFEPEHRRFMETSFTTKFLDYTAFGKPIILWGPDYCTPSRVARRDGGAIVVNSSEPDEILNACRRIAVEPNLRDSLARQARQLHEGVFNPDRLQGIFVEQLEKLVAKAKST